MFPRSVNITCMKLNQLAFWIWPKHWLWILAKVITKKWENQKRTIARLSPLIRENNCFEVYQPAIFRRESAKPFVYFSILIFVPIQSTYQCFISDSQVLSVRRKFHFTRRQIKLDSMRERLFKRLIDVFVLVELKKKSMSGYDVISMLHNKYDVLVSPGTVYAMLYSLEREGLIEGRWDERKRVYGLTSLGLRDECLLKAAGEEVQLLLANMQEAAVWREPFLFLPLQNRV